MMQELKLPSGSTLKIGLAPFSDAKALLQTVTDELRSVPFGKAVDYEGIIAQAILIGVSSAGIEKRLWACMQRCLIDDVKITMEYFEPEEKRDDWLIVSAAVMRATILPFAKSLWHEFVRMLEAVNSFQTPTAPKTT